MLHSLLVILQQYPASLLSGDYHIYFTSDDPMRDIYVSGFPHCLSSSLQTLPLQIFSSNALCWFSSSLYSVGLI